MKWTIGQLTTIADDCPTCFLAGEPNIGVLVYHISPFRPLREGFRSLAFPAPPFLRWLERSDMSTSAFSLLEKKRYGGDCPRTCSAKQVKLTVRAWPYARFPFR